MSGSLSIRLHSPLLKVGHAQYRQLNLELEDYFHKKWELFSKFGFFFAQTHSLQAFHRVGASDNTRNLATRLGVFQPHLLTHSAVLQGLYPDSN